MKHTYFYSTLDWRARGTYYDKSGTSCPLYGEVRIQKEENEWTLSGFMELRTEKPIRLMNDYKIYPTSEDTTLRWESFNPALGTLNGTFEVVGESVLSVYHSEDGVYSGTETLTWKDDFTYYNVGVCFQNGEKLSSWTAMLKGRKKKKIE